jgi:hypothetical protein
MKPQRYAPTPEQHADDESNPQVAAARDFGTLHEISKLIVSDSEFFRLCVAQSPGVDAASFSPAGAGVLW